MKNVIFWKWWILIGIPFIKCSFLDFSGFLGQVNRPPSRNRAVWYSVVVKHIECKMTFQFGFWIVTLYDEDCIFAILFRKQTTNLLNITTSAVPCTEEKCGLTSEWIVCRWRIAICKCAYSTEDLKLLCSRYHNR